MTERPIIASVYKQDDGSLWMTVRKYVDDMESFACDRKFIRGNRFNQVYLINMEESELPEDIKEALKNCLVTDRGTIQSLYYDKAR